MWIGAISIFPEMFRAVTDFGVLSRAIERGIVNLDVLALRDFAADRHATVDDRPYGGGPGMVMQVEPLQRAIAAANARSPQARAHTIYLSPQGRRLTQDRIEVLADQPALLFVCGRYEGVDERLLRHAVDEELSLGDYVVSGGELAAMVVIDAIARHLPGTLGNAESLVAESHVAGLLDCPHYTRPERAYGESVPAPLVSGDHEAVRRWRRQMALGRTYERRPDLLTRQRLSAEDRAMLSAYLAESEAPPLGTWKWSVPARESAGKSVKRSVKGSVKKTE